MRNERLYTLLIWETVPENTTLYLIPNDEISEEHRRFLREADGKLINCDDSNEGMDFLNIALSPKPDTNGEPHACTWRKYKVCDRGEMYGECRPLVSNVYMSGFVL